MRFLRVVVLNCFFGAMFAGAEEGDLADLVSPKEEARVSFSFKEGVFHYGVSWRGEVILKPSKLGFVFAKAEPLDGPFEVVKREEREIDEKWTPVWGQLKEIKNQANEVTITLKETELPRRVMEVTFRAYEDGVAFRYHLPKQTDLDEFELVDELTTFEFAEDGKAWWVEDQWDTYERDYQTGLLSQAASEGMSTPATFQTPKGTYVSLHEADLTDWAGMTLKRAKGGSKLSMEAKLVPWFKSEVKVKGQTPHFSPWRTIQLADTPGGLITSSLILNCNDPCEIEDTSWIEPAKFMGIWWGCITGVWDWAYESNPDKHGATTARAKRYIDACARNGIPCLLIEGWNEGWEGGIPGWRYMDLTKPQKDFDIKEVVSYGKEKGVTLVGHHETGGDVASYERQIKSAFSFYKKYGINRIKTGYVSGDKPIYTEGLTPHGLEHHHGQFNVRHHQKVIELAAKNQIMIDAHEPIKATGISRTWPNFVAREGARGGEFNHFIGNPPTQTCTLPFTRMLGGPMDYTPGIFDTGYQPGMPFGTRAQQLALYVVIWSPLQMAADFYQSYEGEPAMQFIRNVPVGKWDETIVPQAEIGKYVITARREGRSWFVGGITNEEERTLKLPLDFLEEGTSYNVVLYSDGQKAHYRDDPYPVRITEGKVNREKTLTLNMKAGGGVAIEIYPEGVDYVRPKGDAGLIYRDENYQFRAKHSGRLMTAKGSQVIQMADQEKKGQQWTMKPLDEWNFQICLGEKALTATGRENGDEVVLEKADPTNPQQSWHCDHIVGSWYVVYLAGTKQVLNLAGISYAERGKVELWEWSHGPNQIWSLERMTKP